MAGRCAVFQRAILAVYEDKQISAAFMTVAKRIAGVIRTGGLDASKSFAGRKRPRQRGFSGPYCAVARGYLPMSS